jgi:hypothetical protein
MRRLHTTRISKTELAHYPGSGESASKGNGGSLQAKLDHFPNAFHESVEVFGLSMAAPQGRNGGDIISVFVSFDDNRELSLSFHETILVL